ncbi:AEC family transporter [Vibrio cholerae]
MASYGYSELLLLTDSHSMVSTFFIICPIFALIFSGWLLRYKGWVGDQATTELNKFVVFLALPALLFDIVSTSEWKQLWRPEFISAFLLATAVLFTLTLLFQLNRGRVLADASIDALNSSYANTGFMGFPILLAIVGEESQTYALSATIITVCILFAISIILIECGCNSGKSQRNIAKTVLKKVSSNPIIVAPFIAAIVPIFDLHLPQFLGESLDLLGGAAAPCALVTIGLFLGGGKTKNAKSFLTKRTIAFVFTKLIIHPTLVLIVVSSLFSLSDTALLCIVLLSALPTGTGPFMVAEYYRRECTLTSDVILLSTVLSPLTLALLVYFFQLNS